MSILIKGIGFISRRVILQRKEEYKEVMNSPWYQRTVKKISTSRLEELLMSCALSRLHWY
jgi:hypothetical protein